MPVKIVKINSETLPAIADAIRAKTGSTGSILPSQMAGKIANIHTGGELPVLSSPAGVGHVVSGKEYIDAAGNKQTGTMVVCDTIQEAETIGIAGTGVSLELESTADGSTKTMTLPEPNLKSENIVAGSSIFGVPGTAKKLRVETGTITPEPNLKSENIVAGSSIFGVPGTAKKLRVETGTITPEENTTTITIPCSAGFKYAVICATSENINNGDMLGAIVYAHDRPDLFGYNCSIAYHYQDKNRMSLINIDANNGIILPEITNYLFYRAGVNYAWTAYYWEENQ